MDIVVDTSALLAVILKEPERARIVELTTGHALVGPGSVPWEIGNAFSAMLKRKRITLAQAQKGMEIFHQIPLRLLRVDMARAVALVHQTGMYAYDAYFLECAVRHGAPLLTLDRGLKRAAKDSGITLLEV